MELYKYQKQNLNEIYSKFKQVDKLCYMLPTSGGKTFVFSHLNKFWVNKFGTRVLVLCHREELVYQAIEEMNRMGVTCEKVMPKNKILRHDSDVYCAMIETAYRRLLKNPYFFKNVGLIVCDEAHVQVFTKIFSFFPGAKILGVTATPVVQKRIPYFKCKYCKSEYQEETECCDEVPEAWTKPFAMSSIYEDIVLGPKISELIDDYGSLVRDIAFNETCVDTDNLKTDSDGEFTTQSLDDEYSKDGAVFNLLLNYEKLCHGKKTIIFNSSSKTNLINYTRFKEAGINVRMYDSVNKEQSGNRKELIDWFKSEDDAVLMNVGCFIAGFSVKEVQAIMINTAIGSLASYIQICGRGARITDKFYKDHFILVDGGGNINRHQEFSDPTRDWLDIFWNGLGKPRTKKENPIDVNSCMECGFMYMKSEPACPNCGAIIPPPTKKDKEEVFSDTVLKPIREIPPPNGERIYTYTVSRGENINFAFKILLGQIVDMFRYYRVTKEQYVSAKQKGELEKKVKKMIHKCYFTLLSKPDIKAENNRTIKYLLDKAINKLDIYYNLI